MMRIWMTFFACVFMLSQGAAAAEPEKAASSPAAKPAQKDKDVKKDAKEAKKDEKDAAKEEPPKRTKPLTEKEVAEMVKVRLVAMQKAKAIRDAESRAKAAREAELARLIRSEQWSYEGEIGPQQWSKINPKWAKCESGNRQSPIDIRDGIPVDLEPVAFDYQPSRFNVVNNGHTIEVNVGGDNSFILTGRRYQLVQFHFHRPAEEKVNGRGFDMVAHLVHKDKEGRLAVIAVLIESGMPHSLIQTVWNNLPLEKNEPVEPTIAMDVTQLLPQRREYYTYMGSLTTPPCSEGVLWIVMKQPIQASPQQIAVFSRLYPMNARPIQATAGRLIKESN